MRPAARKMLTRRTGLGHGASGSRRAPERCPPLALAATVLLGISSGTAPAQSDNLPRGCNEMPYVRYEAEAGTAGGGAVSRTA